MLKEIEKAMRARQWAKAAALGEELIEEHPAHAKLNAYLGECYAALGRDSEAVEPLRRAAILQPHFWQASLKLAEVLDRLGRYEEAFEHAKNALKEKPGCEEIEALARGLERQLPPKVTDSWQVSTRPMYYTIDFAHSDEHEQAKR